MSPSINDRIAKEPPLQALFSAARKRCLAKQQVVIDEGTKPDSLFLIMSGTVAVTSASGEDELLLAYMFPGDFFGEMGLFPDVALRSARISTRTECMLLEIGYDRFARLSEEHPQLWAEIAAQLARNLRAVNRRLAEMPTLHAADRLWQVLSDLASHGDGPRSADGVEVRVTRSDLGKLAGCSRELAGMVLHDLSQAGKVKLKGHAIVVCR